jgi:hypothetical protein
MKRHTRLTGRQDQHQEQEQVQASQHTHEPALEFNAAEDLLRHDALHTPVPPNIAQRLQAASAEIPRPPARKSWWRRMVE